MGVDPGLHRTGVAFIEGGIGALTLQHSECVVVGPGDPDADRLARLFAHLEALIDAHRPDVASVEQLFFATNRTTAFRVSQARGVALCALARGGVEVFEYTPMQVKESVAGWGGARKPQVARMTCAMLGVDSIAGPDDVTDACAIAVCHVHRAPLNARMHGAGAGTAAHGRRTLPALARAVDAARARQSGEGAG